MNEKDRISNGANNDSELVERLRMYDHQLGKFEQLQEELFQKDKLISDLQVIVNNSTRYSKPNNIYSPNTPVSKIIINLLMRYLFYKL